ncbi:MAG: DUF6064 family protein [Kiloniellaceae bacterium]
MLSALHAQYNEMIWPAQPIALLLALIVVWLVVSPRRGGMRVTGAILAAAWLWCALVFFLQHFAAYDFMAPVYGWTFVVQAALLLWALTGRQTPLRSRPAGHLGIVLGVIAAALFGLPLVSVAGDFGWAAARLVGVAPGPTALFTLGLLLLAEGRMRWLLMVIPLAWCAVAGVTGWALGVPENLALAGVALAALVLAVAGNWRAN